MGNLLDPENPEWRLVRHFEADAPLTGGPDCPDNEPLIDLIHRTAFLRALVTGLQDEKQPLDATLTALSGLLTGANQMPYSTGADTFAMTALTAFARTLLAADDAAAARTTLGAAPLVSPALTGTPTAPTAAAGTNTVQLATTAFVQAAVAALSSTLAGLSDTNIAGLAAGNLLQYDAATGKWLNRTIAQAGVAPVASPALTGTPTAPTAAAGTNTVQLATTAFVQAAVAELVNSSPAALNTLQELATALGNDANFAVTMTNALAGKQPLDATLTALSGLATGANQMPYSTGADTFAMTALTAFARTLLDDTDATSALATLGVTSGHAAALGPAGHLRLPAIFGGLILQWGTTAGAGSGGTTTLFSTAFPNACFGVVASPRNRADYQSDVRTTTLSSFTIFNATSNAPHFYLALGN